MIINSDRHKKDMLYNNNTNSKCRTCCLITIPIVNVPRETELILSGKNMSFSGDYFQIQIKDYIAM